MTCWLIEHRVRLAGVLYFYEHKIGLFSHYGWTSIAQAAKRFKTKEDAIAYADKKFVSGSTGVKIVEHTFG